MERFLASWTPYEKLRTAASDEALQVILSRLIYEWGVVCGLASDIVVLKVNNANPLFVSYW